MGSAQSSAIGDQTLQGEESGGAAGSSKHADRTLSQRTFFVFGIRIVGLGAAFLMNIALARLIGVEGFGLFSFAVSFLLILEVVAIFGLDGVLVREVAASRERGQLGRIKGLILFCGGAILLLSLLAAALTYGVVSFVLPPSWPYATTLLIAVIALPASALLLGATAVLEAHRQPLIGQIIGAVLRPSFILGSALVLAYYGWTITAEIAALIFVAAYGLGFIFAAGYLLYHLGGHLKSVSADVTPKPWLLAAAGFVFTNAAFIITEQTDVMMLAALSDPASVGIYRSAARYAQLVSFALLAAMPPLRPMISAAFARGDRPTLHYACKRVALIAMVLGLPISLALIFLGKPLMALYGEAFTQGSTALVILVSGQFLNILAGPVGVLMTMTGHERKVAAAVGVSACCNILLNALLIPMFNLEGAAIATAVSLGVWNILMLIWVMKHLAINPTLFGRSRAR
jgi:O-antigen/teichoic acid export membrane protein